jgi:3-hydroxybutyrate dehydrogenase
MLKGKTAVVTGSTSGIGLGIATAFAAEGANLVINGFGDAARIEGIRTGLENSFKIKVLYNGADMLKGSDIASMIATAEAEFGHIDILVNNAGIQFVSPIENFPVEKWDAIIAINLTASFHAIRAAFPGMKARKFGRIINVASAHALIASPFKSAYVAAKHGIAGLIKTVALEGAEFGITANAICPGYVDTPLVRSQIPDTAKARGISEEAVIRDVMLAGHAIKEFVQVDQIGALAVYLAGDQAKTITGAMLPIDGGWTAH